MVPISIQGLCKRFGSLPVLRDVCLDIARGELFFLLGPSGCGKTTLLRHLAGFHQPDAGTIRFGDEDVTRMPAHRRGAGMMFQSYALWPHLSVTQNIAFGLEEQGRPKAEIERRAAEVLELVQLGGLGGRRISQLSGGQQQRVALARALVVRPRCLLLDEPLSNLDAKLRQEMRSEIRRICKESGLTAVYVTHDRDEALSMADRLAVMDSGRLVQTGTPEQVYKSPVNRMVAGFIGETNLIPGTMDGPGADAGFVVVLTAFGRLQGRLSAPGLSPESGAKVMLSLRPEACSLDPAPDALNLFAGHVVDTVYLGATVQYALEMQGGQRLKISETNPRRIRQPSSRAVCVSAAPCDVVILPD